MSHKSPSKVLRNTKRITKFIEKKTAQKKVLTVQKLPELNIHPAAKKILTFSQPTILSVLPTQICLSFSKPVLTDIPPEVSFLPQVAVQNFSSNSLITHLQTTSNIHTQPRPIFSRIPQLDGETEESQCGTCKKIFEDADDIRWHFETQIGRQDCSILRSMLGWTPD